jgi:hypothetical protein
MGAFMKHCCKEMTEALTFKCDQHDDPFDCPDSLICYIPKFDEYGIIIHNGGSAFSQIQYCPFCGSKLPESRRDEWFDKMEELGIDDFASADIPEEYKTDQWFSG